ncbi:NADPH-dependent FMN reductase [Halolamina pelagica]|nr:NAD(P)H-dependent oxidoreductase [Halolamina pelagica]
MTRVVAVSGSLRDGSYTKAALQYALDAAELAGVETELIDLAAVDLPLYDPDRPTAEAGDAEQLLARVRAADGVLLGAPVYHSSYSAAFRNFHDYCSFDEYEETVVGLLVAAGGGTIADTLTDMRTTVRGVHGWTLPTQVGLRNASSRFEERDGEPAPTRSGPTPSTRSSTTTCGPAPASSATASARTRGGPRSSSVSTTSPTGKAG